MYSASFFFSKKKSFSPIGDTLCSNRKDILNFPMVVDDDCLIFCQNCNVL